MAREAQVLDEANWPTSEQKPWLAQLHIARPMARPTAIDEACLPTARFGIPMSGCFSRNSKCVQMPASFSKSSSCGWSSDLWFSLYHASAKSESDFEWSWAYSKAIAL